MQGITKYEQDFYQWTQEQAEFLRSGKFEYLDLANLAEEIASLGRQERRELVNRLGVLIGHILKWEYQPDLRAKSWLFTMKGQQREIIKHLQDNPSLQSYLDEAVARGFMLGLDLVLIETPLQLTDLPQTCPYTFEQIIHFLS